MSATQTAPAKPGSGMRIPGDHVIVLFGATGDLARRKILPGLYHLARAGLLPAGYRIVGTSRRPLSDEAFRAHARAAVVEFGRGELDPEAWDAFAAGLSYASSDAADASAPTSRSTCRRRSRSAAGPASTRAPEPSAT